MGEFTTTMTMNGETPNSSSYRVKFRGDDFLRMVSIAEPKIIYHVGRIHFFSHDGFVMYTMECRSGDFAQTVMEVIEFSNVPWAEKLSY
jgi:hypothetical protein